MFFQHRQMVMGRSGPISTPLSLEFSTHRNAQKGNGRMPPLHVSKIRKTIVLKSAQIYPRPFPDHSNIICVTISGGPPRKSTDTTFHWFYNTHFEGSRNHCFTVLPWQTCMWVTKHILKCTSKVPTEELPSWCFPIIMAIPGWIRR